MNLRVNYLFAPAAILSFLSIATPATAGIIFSLPDITAEADGINPTVGDFFVSIEVDEPSPPQVVGYNIDFDVVGTGVIIGPAVDAPGPWSFGNFSDEDSMPTQNVRAFDLHDASGIAATSGQLAKVSYTIPAGIVEGVFPLVFNIGSLQDQLNALSLDTGAVLLPDELSDGSITVVDINQNNIPEPASVAILALALGAAARRYVTRR